MVLLHNRLSYLLKELEPWEAKLNQATKRARIKLRKEVEDYVEKEDEVWNIRIFNGCGVRIENSVTRVTVRHHKAC